MRLGRERIVAVCDGALGWTVPCRDDNLRKRVGVLEGELTFNGMAVCVPLAGAPEGGILVSDPCVASGSVRLEGKTAGTAREVSAPRLGPPVLRDVRGRA